jgi:hypothetical protein
MATPAEYLAVSTVLQKWLAAEEDTEVPAWARGMIPAETVPKASGALAKLAVDTLDAYRASHKP